MTDGATGYEVRFLKRQCLQTNTEETRQMKHAYTDLQSMRTFYTETRNGTPEPSSMMARDFLFYMSGPIESFMEAAWPDYNPKGLYA
jgi:hypothetical protein